MRSMLYRVNNEEIRKFKNKKEFL